MDDGTEIETSPGDITSLPEGYDAWVLGDEPVVAVQRFGAVTTPRHNRSHEVTPWIAR
jgi:hypothetical protein